MIVYQENKDTFMSQVRESKIEYIIHDNFIKNLGRDTSKSEVNSWKNSMMYMRNVLDDAAIPGDAKISIECQVPNTSKRIDFIITGQTEDRRDCAVIIELKQWETARSFNRP
jgi:putative NIF3 family GTP cyclohydrolase 1 type 2